MTSASLADFSTQAARAAELHRRKLRRALLAQWTATRAAIDAEKAAAVKAINRDELNAAKDEVEQ